MKTAPQNKGQLPTPALPLVPGTQALPINLATALKLGNAQALDIAFAVQQEQVAAAQLEGSQVLWLPTLFMGPDYFRHDGQIQDVAGNVFGTSKSSFMVGVGPSMVFSFSDAIFAPLAARQVLRAREAGVQTAANDTLLAVAQAFFTVQQARGELAGSLDAVQRAEDLLRRVEHLAPGLTPTLEVTRARAQLARRRQTVHLAEERWRSASADLVRVLHLEPSIMVEPLESPNLQVSLLSIEKPVNDLIALGLMNRPELATQRALVQATVTRLRQERWRPLVPSLLVRGASTPVTGTLTAGVFGGGTNESLGNFSMRQDWDVQVLWEFRNLGFGNHALVRQRQAENQAALVDLFRVQDRVAAEVVQAYALAQSAASRVQDAKTEVQQAQESVAQNLLGVEQTKTAETARGKLILLVVRPQEVVAAIDALYQAYLDFYGAVADFNRAQFQLYRALGQPAQELLGDPRCAEPQTAQPTPLPVQTSSKPPLPPANPTACAPATGNMPAQGAFASQR
jgi:outer membrane protein TolC